MVFAIRRWVLRCTEGIVILNDFNVFEAALGGQILHRLLVVATVLVGAPRTIDKPPYYVYKYTRHLPNLVLITMLHP